MYLELMLGCGSRRVKDPRLPTAEEIRIIEAGGKPYPKRLGNEFRNLVTLDINVDHNPDIQFNLERIDGELHNQIPYIDLHGKKYHTPDNFYQEIHAYEVLEHIGRQGDYRKFFAQFEEFWRILAPGGFFFATCPSYRSMWAWGDPSHTRVITEGTLAFLSQAEYERQVGNTAMSDFRFCYQGNFETLVALDNGETLLFVLRAIK